MKRFILLIQIICLPVLGFSQENGIYNIKDYGAVGDGSTLSTHAIQTAIDSCNANGGGKVIVPPGNYVTGALFLKSNIYFEVYSGATLLFDDTIENCPIVDGRWEGIERKVYASLFTGHDLQNVTITGRGMLNGQGEAWWEAFYKTRDIRAKNGITEREPDNPVGSPLRVPRPRMINLYNCTNVLISELTIVNSPSWTIHPVYCENVTIEKISIIQPYDSPNTDGINPESCKNVRILNCFVDCGDDCITIKSGYNEDGRRVAKPCENIVISNCTFAHGHSAIGIGSEMSGDVRNVTISNCVFNGTLRGIRIKTGRGRGGVVENYRADNIIMNNVTTAISIDMYYGNKDTAKLPVTIETPFFKNIQLSNITAVNVENALIVKGLPEAPVEGLSIVNSNFTSKNGFQTSFIENAKFIDVTVNCENGNPLTIDNGETVDIDGFKSENIENNEAIIKLSNSNDIYIHNCNTKESTEIFLQSKNTENLKLDNNWLYGASVVNEK
ncbi:glycoside hydrolase family 28 protein [Mariniflexile sp. HMF6888]|uniref:glycoside hydrolase family 28 protein n=1 Tax=Mariniflexile sp. HMF6888 TaxID=3373086 RepID=UPI0037B35887